MAGVVWAYYPTDSFLGYLEEAIPQQWLAVPQPGKVP